MQNSSPSIPGLNRFTGMVALIVATMFWGFAFVAQKNAMAHIGPLGFIGARYIIGGLVVLPLALWEYRRNTHRFSAKQLWLILGLGLVFFLGSWLQQAGLVHTSVTNSGFLTGLYVFFVPLILLVIFKVKPHNVVWICAPLAFVGLFLLAGASVDGFNFGDLMVIGSAVFWALHVLGLGYLSRLTNLPLTVSCMTFLIGGVLGFGFAFPMETPELSQFANGWIEILYAGIFSTAIGFTLQAVGQIHVPPANAAIILSGESLFAALGGAVILGERLTMTGYFGVALLFLAIVLVEALPALREQRLAARNLAE